MTQPFNIMRSVFKYLVPVLIGLVFAGCSSKESDYARSDLQKLLTEEIGKIGVANYSTLPDGTIGDYESFLTAVLQNDFEIRKIDFEIKNSTITIKESESILLPRVDVVVGVNTAYESDDGWDNRPELGLVVRYDVTGAIFQEDYTNVAIANYSLRKYERDITAKKALTHAHILLLDYLFNKRELALQKEGEQLSLHLLKLHQDADTVLPNVSGLNKKDLEHELFKQRMKIRTLEDKLITLHNKMVHKTGASVNLDLILPQFEERLLSFQEAATQKARGESLQKIVTDSVNINPYAKIFENKLFVARMNILNAKRKKLPRLRASLGGGSLLDTGTEGTSDFVFKLELLYPLFDGGTIERNVEIQRLSLQKTEAEIRNQFQEKVLEIQDSILHLNSSQQKVELLQNEVGESEKKYADVSELRRQMLVDSTLPLIMQKTLLAQKIALLESQRGQGHRTFQFVLLSALQFSPSQQGKKEI